MLYRRQGKWQLEFFTIISKFRTHGVDEDINQTHPQVLKSAILHCGENDYVQCRKIYDRNVEIGHTSSKDVEALEKEMEMKEQKRTVENSFSSLDNMLQWAIGHSDPGKLRVTAQEIQKLSSKELERRREEIKELMEKLRMPSDAELMKIAIADLNNSSLSVDDHH
ncbi:hypothetical protein SUGI_0962240 [Cryptomeria japonica]|nr:hypothetical protein SUGI_0962240 [Cryptomeria japonica]